MAQLGMYTLNINSVKKEVNLEVKGTFTPEKAKGFIDDYNRRVGVIKASDFVLRLDCRDLDLVTQEMVPELESCYRLYKESGFQRVIFEIKKSPVLKMQLSRLVRNAGLTNVEVIED